MDNVGLKNARCVRRILARAKRRSRAFSKVSPSAFLSPFVVELVCDFYFARDSSSSESPAWRYTTPVMPTFCRNDEGVCSKRGGERVALFFARKVSIKLLCVLVFAFFAFFRIVSCFWERRTLSPPFDFNTPTPKRASNKYSQKSLHIISHLHLIIINEISNVREELFSFSEREFRCAEQQQLLFHRLCFFCNRFIARVRV